MSLFGYAQQRCRIHVNGPSTRPKFSPGGLLAGPELSEGTGLKLNLWGAITWKLVLGCRILCGTESVYADVGWS